MFTLRSPLPEPISGKHHPNELDKLFKKLREKCLNQIVDKCERLPHMEFDKVIEEIAKIYDLLDQIEHEVN